MVRAPANVGFVDRARAVGISKLLSLALRHQPEALGLALIPIVGHRYVVPVQPHVVLSVYQTDIIVYGNDLRTFLLAELGPLLGVPRDPAWADANATGIPFWGGFVS